MANDLGKAIKFCRTERNLNQTQLAKSAGISVSYLSLLERNKRDPTMSTLNNIADSLNIPLMMLIFVATDMDEHPFPLEVVEKLSYQTLKLLGDTQS